MSAAAGAVLDFFLEMLFADEEGEEDIEELDEEKIMEEAEATLDLIKREYPTFKDEIKMDITRDADGKIIKVQFSCDNPIMGYLEYGTGIYGPYHKPIVPKNAKALHFKDISIALALGFPTEDVFLKKVKGIRPRFLFIRAIKDFSQRLGWNMFSDRMEEGMRG